jgi:KAP family P-loop domain
MIRINLLGHTRPKSARTTGFWASLVGLLGPKPLTTGSQTGKVAGRYGYKGPEDRRPSLRMLAGKAFADDSEDHLGFKPFADAIAGVIDSPQTATPFVMAINAKWGAGKTTLAQMVRRRLQSKPAAGAFSPHIACWFDAWMHDEAPSLATSLAAEIAQVASSHRSLIRRMFSPLPSTLASASSKKMRKGMNYLLLLVTFIVAVFLISLRLGYSLSEVLKLDPRVVGSITTLPGGGYWGVVLVAAVLIFKSLGAVLPVAKSVGEFVRDPSSAAGSASMNEVRRQLGKLLQQATPRGSKFVVFIDDLDRCRPPRSVDILEVINQLLDQTGVVVVLMADMHFVAKSAEIKYRDILPSKEDRASSEVSIFGWDYLQKVVQLQFDLPIYPISAMQEMIQELAKQVPEEKIDSRIRNFLRSFAPRIKRSPRVILRHAGSFWGIAIISIILAWAAFQLASRGTIFHRLTAVSSTPKLIAAAGALIGVVAGIISRPLSDRVWNLLVTATRRREIDRQIRTRIAAGERDFSKVEAQVRKATLSGRKNDQLEGLVRERLQRYLEDESELQIEAEDEVMRHLEPMPRHAKRLLNRLRLLLFIAHERKMFGGAPNLKPRHIGKWAVLCERWPALALALSQDPTLMVELESASTHADAIRQIGEIYLHDTELSEFCLSNEEIRLADVIHRIVQFAPAESTKH